MHRALGATLSFAVLLAYLNPATAQKEPIPANLVQAQLPLGFSLKSRCPDLRMSDDPAAVVVQIWVPRSGIPAHATIKSSSGSEALDKAALTCVSKLRFVPAARLGDGEPFDTWQEVALSWARSAYANRGPPPVPPNAAKASGEPSGQSSAAPQPSSGERPGDLRASESREAPATVSVHLCVDEGGKIKQGPTIVHSSGNAQLDEAASRIASSGAAYYHPRAGSGHSGSGCAQLTIQFDSQ